MDLIPPNVPTSFLQEWFRSPARIGAIAPSGSRLASAMTEGVSHATGPIVELGPGTGVFTKLLLERGVKPEDIAAVELASRFAGALRDQFPSIHVIEGDAAQVEQLSPFSNGTVGKVLCGLPLLSMPEETVASIVTGSFRLLRQDGSFRLFTYGASCPITKHLLERENLAAARISRTLLNVPPATVYEIKKNAGSSGRNSQSRDS